MIRVKIDGVVKDRMLTTVSNPHFHITRPVQQIMAWVVFCSLRAQEGTNQLADLVYNSFTLGVPDRR